MKFKSLKVAILVSFLSICGISTTAIADSTNANLAAKTESKSKIESVNVNQANAKELAAILKGIGLKKAEAIVAFREKNGIFKSLEELTQVKGIGEKTLAKNKARIQF